MIIAINDISFKWKFANKYDASAALNEFGDVCLGIMDEKVSNVAAEREIVNSPEVNKATELAPDYTLMQALNDMKNENREQFQFILSILTRLGPEDDEHTDTFTVGDISSTFCACHKDDFLLSLVSSEEFQNEVVCGFLNGTQECEIKNISCMDCMKIEFSKFAIRI